MKKTLSVLAILSLLFIQKTSAQLEKGNVLIGADLANFNFNLNKGGAVTIDISPSAAWFINDNLAIGPKLTINPVFHSEGGGTDFTWAIDAFGRYYLSDQNINLLKHGRWFFEALAGVGGTNIAHGTSTNGLDIGFGPGYAYFVTSSVALETLLEYKGTIGFGSAAYNSNLNLNFGLQIYLPGKATMNKVTNEVK
jgi:hypothetical protein